jgi:hypothetical protein
MDILKHEKLLGRKVTLLMSLLNLKIVYINPQYQHPFSAAACFSARKSNMKIMT